MSFNFFNVGDVGDSSFPYISLGTFPTRLEKLERLGQRLSLYNLWIKRDDESGIPFGGNKVRKLEFVLADVMAKKKEELIAIGAKGSNSVLATAIYASRLGIKTVALLFDQDMTKRTSENFEMIEKIASKIYLIPIKNVGDVGNLLSIPIYLMKVMKAIAQHKRAYFVAPGCSSSLGVIGYVKAAFELKEQVESGKMPEPEFIFLPFGTGGTAVGLSLGAKLAGLKSRIIAVRVADKIVANSISLKILLRKKNFIPHCPDLDNLEIMDGCFGAGYGVPTEEAKEALELMRSCEGIELDETYTAKAFAGLIKYVKGDKEHRIESGSRPILFWNTFAPFVESLNKERLKQDHAARIQAMF